MDSIIHKKNNERSIEPFANEKSPMQWFLIAFIVFIVLVALYFLLNTNLIS